MIMKKGKIVGILSLSLLPALTSLGLILGYYLTKFFAGEKPGKEGKIKSLIISVKQWKIHLHHWFVGLIFLFISLFYDILPLPQFFLGVLGGVCLQGLTYSDWYRIITKQVFNENFRY